MRSQKNKLQVNKFLPATEEQIFANLTNPDIIEKCFCPEGMEAKVDEWVVLIDGALRISISDGEEVYTSIGKFKEVTPPHKLVFTYGWEEDDQVETLVTIELKKLENGVDIILTQEGIDQEEIAELKKSWLHALTNLTKQIV
jgi:uncharacterized protein YndB with AHSA1/START domain